MSTVEINTYIYPQPIYMEICFSVLLLRRKSAVNYLIPSLVSIFTFSYFYFITHEVIHDQRIRDLSILLHMHFHILSLKPTDSCAVSDTCTFTDIAQY